MKRLTIFLSTIIIAIIVLAGLKGLISAQTNTGGDENTLIIYNWGDYIDPDLLTKFEEETGFYVIYETFDSNEAMETKVTQGGTRYDLAFPSESIIPKMVDKNLLLPLDHEEIIGLDQISDFLLDQEFDIKNQFTIPYFWGTVGIMVNTKEIPLSQIMTWGDLWDPSLTNELLLIDGARESMGMALQSLGMSLNETDVDKLEQASDHLAKLMPNTKAILTDEIKTLMINGEADLGIGYSGDAAYVASQNPDVEYVLPEDGSAVWTDNFAIPRTMKNKEGTYAFINFMLRSENAKQNAEYVEYATPNEAAKKLLDIEVTQNKALYPDPEDLQHLEHYKYLGLETINYYNELFLNIKMGL